MFLEIGNVEYWLVNPTEQELKSVRKLNAVHRRVWGSNSVGKLLAMYGVGALAGLIAGLVFMNMYIGMYAGSSVLIIGVVWQFGGFAGRHRRRLRRAAKEKRLFSFAPWITKYSDDSIVLTLLHRLLCGGVRTLESTSQEMDILKQAKPSEVNSFISCEANRQALAMLQRYSSNQQVCDHIRVWLEPRFAVLRDPKVLDAIMEQQRENQKRQKLRDKDDFDAKETACAIEEFDRFTASVTEA